jgi:hypothetical protein
VRLGSELTVGDANLLFALSARRAESSKFVIQLSPAAVDCQ